MRILIVEDDPEIAEGLEIALRRAGFQTEVASDGPSGEEAAILNSYGVILLDWMLPGRDGRQVCKNLRSCGIDTPIVMVTARDQVSDRVAGLDIGADDYLVKPFAVEELLARIRSVTRRTAKEKGSSLSFGDLVLDSGDQTVRKAGAAVHLTQREFSLLEALMRNAGRVLTRDAILERVWNNDEALPNTVSFHMKSLRRKVDPEGKYIQTVHGLGYAMRTEGG